MNHRLAGPRVRDREVMIANLLPIGDAVSWQDDSNAKVAVAAGLRIHGLPGGDPGPGVCLALAADGALVLDDAHCVRDLCARATALRVEGAYGATEILSGIDRNTLRLADTQAVCIPRIVGQLER